MKRVTTALILAAAMAGALLAIPLNSSAQVSVGISVNVGPPPIPYYPQPFVPGPGYMWTPGYWAYGTYGYYWVPGTWVLAPAVGLLWTPGWWGWRDGRYWWNAGYWGPRVGFYGGINYGYGYGGAGYRGGYWRGGGFYYNHAVNNVNVTYIHNTYNQAVVNNTTINRVSYNGGRGGITARPTAEQESYARAKHVAPTAAQYRQERVAMNNPAQRFSTNHGRPNIAATAQAGKFSGPGVVRMNKARGTYAYRPAPRDKQAFQSTQRPVQSRQPEARSDHPGEGSMPPTRQHGNPNTERRAQGQSHPQGHENSKHPKKPKEEGRPPR
ncbi:MAG: hypothetical protein WCC11_04300 [Gammaproteobacteria bacterium]